MDSMYVIGYRIDLQTDKDLFDIEETLTSLGISIDGLPGKDWMLWNNDEKTISFWQMNGDFKVDYRCPIDREEIYHDLKIGEHFDTPRTYEFDIKQLKETKLYQSLTKLYGDTNLTTTWGIAIMLG
jgi:hypothetical protein